MKENDIIRFLEKRLSASRFLHSLGVADTAEKIARQQRVPVYKARHAGLLHDYAKVICEKDLKNIAIRIQGWGIDEQELQIPQVLHAPVSAYLVKKKFGIDDGEIIEAIRYHTIGSPGMGELAKILFVADFIEPNRDYKDVIEARERLEDGLAKTIIFICESKIKYNLDQGRLIHPNTVLLRNAYLREEVMGC